METIALNASKLLPGDIMQLSVMTVGDGSTWNVILEYHKNSINRPWSMEPNSAGCAKIARFVEYFDLCYVCNAMFFTL